jgi:hypothetical protein
MLPAAAFAVCSGSSLPVADAEPVWVPLAMLVTADPEAEPVAEAAPEEGTAVGMLDSVTPASAQSLDTAGASSKKRVSG